MPLVGQGEVKRHKSSIIKELYAQPAGITTLCCGIPTKSISRWYRVGNESSSRRYLRLVIWSTGTGLGGWSWCLQRHMERFTFIWMLKCRTNKVPTGLEIEINSSGRLGKLAVVLSLSRGCCGRSQAQCEESFAVGGTRLRDLLPAEISVMYDSRTFKSSLND